MTCPTSPNTYQTVHFEYLMQEINKIFKSKPYDKNMASHEDVAILDQVPLNQLCQILKLSHFDRNILLLCLAYELWPEFPTHLPADVNKEDFNQGPTLQLAQRLFHGKCEEILNPNNPLFFWELVKRSGQQSIHTQPLRLCPSIFNYLIGYNTPNDSLFSWLMPLSFSDSNIDFYQTQEQQIINFWQMPTHHHLLQLTGDNLDDQRYTLLRTAEKQGFSVYVIDCEAIPIDREQWRKILRLLMRETWLHSNRLYLILSDEVPQEKQFHITQLLQAVPSHGVLLSRSSTSWLPFPLTNIHLTSPNNHEQYAIWQQALNEQSGVDDEHLAQLSSQFSFSVSCIQQIASEFNNKSAVHEQSLWQQCRLKLRSHSGMLFNIIEPRLNWTDLSLPLKHQELLKTIVIHVKQRNKVYYDWRFADKNPRGLGISALFSGPSGTGKTLAAEVIAHDLQLDIYHIDLSTIVSKYIGETEKHLNEIFTCAEKSGAILLFDEADALFGKRKDVKSEQSHYANLQVNYLLQRMESYRGLSILTTNLKTALDEAFLRRIRFIMKFPFPDHEQRRKIWQNIFPDQAPLQNLDFDKLARLNLAGGHIRNIALNAAFFAAEQQQPIKMSHLLQAAHNEYLKLERVLLASDTQGWV